MDKRLTASILGAIFVVGTVGFFFTLNIQPDITPPFTPETPQPYKPEPNVFTEETPISELETVDGLVKFTSDDEIRQFLLDASKRYETDVAYSTGSGIPFGFAPEPRPQFGFEENFELAQRSLDASLREGGTVPSPYGTEYSTTNVQVANVDEPDYLKNDGKYLYILSQNTLTIIEAYPAENAKVLLKIGLDIEPQELQNMFLNDDRLVIFYRGSGQVYGIDEFDFEPRPVYHSKTFATILDVSDRENPSIVTKYEVDGDYHNSRMIGDVVYLLTTNYADYHYPIIPRILTQERMIAPDVYYFPNPEQSYNFNTVTAFDVAGNFKNSETFLMGYTNTIYVSEDNLYITYQKNIPPSFYEDNRKDRFFDVVVPLLPKEVQEKIKEIQNDSRLDSYEKWNMVSNLLQETYNKMPKEDRERLFNEIRKTLEDYDRRIQEDVRRTAIHKIALDDGNLRYISNGEVPGYPLNQFSMDEYKGKFRIATTSESYSMHGTTLSNNVYVLDNELKIIGSLEKIAKDESIYSARFMGDKLYLVTFQRIDPFFVIDLSENKPKILGELKIPGFSQYLHPYDENHVIGIGRDTKEHKEGWVETLGVKLALYDVSDFDNPKEADVITIGDSSTDSEILYNHKAFLLDKNKNIMSIPIKGSIHPSPLVEREGYYPTDKIWNGFYVYGINGDGFDLKGKITHYNSDVYPTVYMQSRSFYIDNTLYTVMDGSVKMNDINNIENEVNSLELLQTGNLVKIID
jgi:uncharacterized secreted protein with C-terminal beta-propeller domain